MNVNDDNEVPEMIAKTNDPRQLFAINLKKKTLEDEINILLNLQNEDIKIEALEFWKENEKVKTFVFYDFLIYYRILLDCPY